MATIDERKVQGAALHYLHSRYAKQHPDKPFFVDAEKRVRDKKSISRADGLLCYPLTPTTFYTVSLEAKSLKTWHNLEVFNWDERLALEAICGCLLLVSLSVFLTWSLAWYWILLAAISAIVFTIFLVGYFVNSPRYVQSEVFAQVAKYAANERWIALSSQVYDLLNNKTQIQHFESLCLRHKCGLLLVNRRGKVNEKIAPVPMKGQFLDRYLAASQIKEALLTNSTAYNYRSCYKWIGKGKRKISSFLCSNGDMLPISPETTSDHV